MSKLAIKEILEKTLNNSNPFRDIPNGIKIKNKKKSLYFDPVPRVWVLGNGVQDLRLFLLNSIN